MKFEVLPCGPWPAGRRPCRRVAAGAVLRRPGPSGVEQADLVVIRGRLTDFARAMRWRGVTWLPCVGADRLGGPARWWGLDSEPVQWFSVWRPSRGHLEWPCRQGVLMRRSPFFGHRVTVRRRFMRYGRETLRSGSIDLGWTASGTDSMLITGLALAVRPGGNRRCRSSQAGAITNGRVVHQRASSAHWDVDAARRTRCTGWPAGLSIGVPGQRPRACPSRERPATTRLGRRSTRILARGSRPGVGVFTPQWRRHERDGTRKHTARESTERHRRRGASRRWCGGRWRARHRL